MAVKRIDPTKMAVGLKIVSSLISIALLQTKEGEVVEGYPLKTQINRNKERPQREKNPPWSLGYWHFLVTPSHDFLQKASVRLLD
jgi:hypothetical protein